MHLPDMVTLCLYSEKTHRQNASAFCEVRFCLVEKRKILKTD